MQNVLIRPCHILEYTCTLYTDIFAVEMEVSLNKRIASRGWHFYGKTVIFEIFPPYYLSLNNDPPFKNVLGKIQHPLYLLSRNTFQKGRLLKRDC